jgi:hypothetical protein
MRRVIELRAGRGVGAVRTRTLVGHACRLAVAAAICSLAGVAGTCAAASADPTPVESLPPLGVQINTISGPNGVVQIGGQSYGEGALRLVAVNRTSLAVQTFSYANDPSAFDALATKIDEYDDGWLLIVTAPTGVKLTDPGDFAAFENKIVKRIGGAPLSKAFAGAIPPLSVLGVHGWDAGSAYESQRVTAEQPDTIRNGALVGYLQRNPESGALGFTFPDYPTFETSAENSRNRGRNSNTMFVGEQRSSEKPYQGSLPDGEAGFHILTLDRYSLRLGQNKAWPTNGTSNDRDAQAALADYLTDAGAQYLVFVQSIGSPHPTTSAWNEISAGISRLGGLSTIFNSLTDHSRYALVGGVDIKQRATESINDANTLQDGTLSGQLARDRDASFAPLLTNADGGVDGTELLQLAYAPASVWPDRSTQGLRNAISYIADKLQLHTTDPYLVYNDLTIDFGAAPYYGALQEMAFPGGSVEFTDPEFTTVKTELLNEFLWVTKVRSFTEEVQKLLQQSVIIKQGELATLARDIKDKSGAGAKTTTVSPYAIYEGLFSIGKALGVPGAGLISGAFKIAGALTKEKGADVLGKFTASTDDLGSELVKRFQDGLTSLSLMTGILVSDHDKLQTAGLNIINRRPGWVWTQQSAPMAQRALTLAAKRYFSERLISVVYRTYGLPRSFQDAAQCRVLGGEPASAWLSHIDTFNDSGPGTVQPITSAWGIGTQQEDDRYGRMKANPALIDPLFEKVSPDSTDRLGLSKPTFIEKVLPFQALGSHFCNQLAGGLRGLGGLGGLGG